MKVLVRQVAKKPPNQAPNRQRERNLHHRLSLRQISQHPALLLPAPSIIGHPSNLPPHGRFANPDRYTEAPTKSPKRALTLPQYDSQFEENLYNLRRDKLAQIAALARAHNPAIASDLEAKFPNTFRFTATIPELRAIGDPLDTEALAAAPIQAAIAGRLMAIRVQGKAGFAQLQQGGQRLQLYIRKDDVGPELFDLYKLLDLGDHIGVRGYLMRTRTGELTLHAGPITLPGHEGQPAITFLAKSMLALPDKFSGLEDIETRYRRRYVDLIMNSGNAVKPAPAIPSELPSPSGQPSASESPSPSGLSSRSAAEGSASPAAAPSSPESATPGLAGGFSPLNEAAQEGASAPAEPEAPTNVREVFVKRAAILRSIRAFFDQRGYLEVETPMLHTIAGGATARTFSTHHNAENMELTLRIAPELHLKRLVVGGLDRVYEINRNFRNEGTDRSHNPEFTMLEFYQAYANYHDLMDLTEELIKVVAMEVNGTTITRFNDCTIDLGKWTRISMREAIIEFWPDEFGAPPSMAVFDSKEEFRNLILRALESYGDSGKGVGVPADAMLEEFYLTKDDINLLALNAEALKRDLTPLGRSIADLFELVAEGWLIQPTIIYDFPLAVSPLSKVKPDEPDWVERFEFYIGGFEVGNAFSELNDADDQLRRFQSQLEDRKRGDEEAMAEVDEDYVRALGYGLPPTAGEGIGIDRLTMILTGSRSIRDVILFPLMRPTKSTPEAPPEPGESAE
jgi:lysyl-tRNA synthetase class 2